MDGREFSLLVLCMYIDVQMMMAAGVITDIGRGIIKIGANFLEKTPLKVMVRLGKVRLG